MRYWPSEHISNLGISILLCHDVSHQEARPGVGFFLPIVFLGKNISNFLLLTSRVLFWVSIAANWPFLWCFTVAAELCSMYVSNRFEHLLTMTAFQSCGISTDFTFSLLIAREAVKTLIFSIHLYVLHY